MHHTNILADAAAMLQKRGADYGSVEDTFDRACIIFEAMTGSAISPWQGAMFMQAMKMARIRTSATKADNYIDGVNYLAFAGQFATGGAEQPKQAAQTVKVSGTMPGIVIADDLEDGIKEIAAKFAPVMTAGNNGDSK